MRKYPIAVQSVDEQAMRQERLFRSLIPLVRQNDPVEILTALANACAFVKVEFERKITDVEDMKDRLVQIERAKSRLNY